MVTSDRTDRTDRTGRPRRTPRRWLAVTVVAWWLFTLLAVLVAWGWDALLGADRAASVATHHAVLAHPALLAAARTATDAGAALTTDLVTLAATVVFAVRRRVAVAVFMLSARAGDAALDELVKHLVARPRPNWVHPVAHTAGYAFPSGHTAGATAVYGALAVLVVLATRRRWVAAVALATVVLTVAAVAASRVLLGVHYPTDVTAGALLSTGWVSACTAALTGRRRPPGGAP